MPYYVSNKIRGKILSTYLGVDRLHCTLVVLVIVIDVELFDTRWHGCNRDTIILKRLDNAIVCQQGANLTLQVVGRDTY